MNTFLKLRRDWTWIGIGKAASLALVILVPFLGGGCLSRPGLVKQTFAFAPLTVHSNTPPVGNRVLAIRKLTVEAPFDSSALVYRTGEYSYEHDYYAGFLISPAESLATPIREFFRGNGPFGAVSEPGSALKPNTAVEITVHELYGDFRKPGQAAAVLGMRFLFFDAPNGVPGNVLSADNYSLQVPIHARTAAALVEGWNQALQQILPQAIGDFIVATGKSKGASTPVSTVSGPLESSSQETRAGR
jgi:hypothetical protein